VLAAAISELYERKRHGTGLARRRPSRLALLPFPLLSQACLQTEIKALDVAFKMLWLTT
jgi:hypothetical protein